jgi:Domain of unknown function (DUF4160)
MPKLYEYFGLRVYFYANEHEPVHVHGFYQGRESKAEIVIKNGVIVGIRILVIPGMNPLKGRALRDFKLLLSRKAEDVVEKWISFFVHHQQIETETISRRLK